MDIYAKHRPCGLALATTPAGQVKVTDGPTQDTPPAAQRAAFPGHVIPSPQSDPRIPAPEEEIAYGPAAWLWDYLRYRYHTGLAVGLIGWCYE
jgi:NAD+ synthase (glutamine-hydrolysing)